MVSGWTTEHRSQAAGAFLGTDLSLRDIFTVYGTAVPMHSRDPTKVRA